VINNMKTYKLNKMCNVSAGFL